MRKLTIMEDNEKALRDEVALLQQNIEVLVTRDHESSVPMFTMEEIEDAMNKSGVSPRLWGSKLGRMRRSGMSY